MASRMEKYYSNVKTTNSRTTKNSALYDKIYDGSEYSNVEGIATIERSNEIDIDKIKQLLKQHDELKNDKNSIIRRQEKNISYEQELEEEKKYDIKDALIKAKSETVVDNRNRSLKNTQYDILKNINLKSVSEDNDNSLKELINTITSTSMLNKMEDKDLSLDLLGDLKSTGNTMVNVKPYKEELKNEPEGIDKSFYTSNLGFNEKDFEELGNIKSSLKKNNLLISVLVFTFLVFIIAVIAFVLYNF